MSGLVGKTIKSAYKSLLRINDDSNGVDASVEVVTDGAGNQSSLYLGNNGAQIYPQSSNGTTTFTVRNRASDVVLGVDTSDKIVKAGAQQLNVFTQYAYFGVNYSDFSHPAANTHYPIPFMAASGGASAGNDVDFGTSTDPDTTFTTADTDTQYAAQLVPMLWHIQDNITIDAVTAYIGADSATTDSAARIHLMSYTFNSGSTSALTSGDLVAYSAADINNLGNEQAYRQSLTIDSTGNDIDANKVVLAFYRSDSVNSDFSLNITVKYHIR